MNVINAAIHNAATHIDRNELDEAASWLQTARLAALNLRSIRGRLIATHCVIAMEAINQTVVMHALRLECDA